MKNTGLLLAFTGCLFFAGCQENEQATEFTGRTTTYSMLRGSYFEQETSGTLTVRERADGSLQLEVLMEGTLAGASHPVHLHRGNLLEDETVAAYLSPLEDIGRQQSRSITVLSSLEGEPLTYEAFLQLDGSVKVHFQETGELKNVLLGAVNVGANHQAADIRLDTKITTCNSF